MPDDLESRSTCRTMSFRHRADYQARALRELFAVGMQPVPWAWITTICETNYCLNHEHMHAHAPLRLAYPHSICIYCGEIGYTRDHLMPQPWTGPSQRQFVTTVPACGECNSLINDSPTWSLNERRAIAHERIRRKHFAVLRTANRTERELAEYGLTLRSFIKAGMAERAKVEVRLEWPTDPAYDLRALAHSGIEDPYAVGLLTASESLQDVREHGPGLLRPSQGPSSASTGVI